MLTIVCLAYNHARFVAKAIDGFLMQETSFPVEIIIHDDASSDLTPDIIRAYEKQYPHFVRGVLQRENQMGAGKAVLPLLLQQARGEFIAYCEADDYWTAPNKLQSQVDRLRSNPRCMFTAHAVSTVDIHGDPVPGRGIYHRAPSGVVHFEDVLERHFIPTLSLVFRMSAMARLPDCYGSVLNGDIVLTLTFTALGHGWFDQRRLGVYRVHGGGITKVQRTPIEWWQSDRTLYEGMDAYTGGMYHGAIQRQLALVDCRYGGRLIMSGALLDGLRVVARAIRADPLVLVRLVIDRLRLVLQFPFPRDPQRKPAID